MKTVKKIFWILAISLIFTTTLVAQSNGSEPTDFGTTGDTANNPTDVPIDNYLIFLCIAGISYVFYKVQTLKKQ
ncbi:MAG: hypothetical protein KA264_05135 [Crocinitomicaceae bacterium]|nr:hypothetical protein [Crocinitomicaceae bacterium]